MLVVADDCRCSESLKKHDTHAIQNINVCKLIDGLLNVTQGLCGVFQNEYLKVCFWQMIIVNDDTQKSVTDRFRGDIRTEAMQQECRKGSFRRPHVVTTDGVLKGRPN